MYANTIAAIGLDQHRAADLARDVELLRRQAEHPESILVRPSAFAVVTGWFTHARRHPRTARVVAASH